MKNLRITIATLMSVIFFNVNANADIGVGLAGSFINIEASGNETSDTTGSETDSSVNSATVDPKDFSESSFVDRNVDYCIIPPNSFALAKTVEYFKIPRETLVICVGKSTYARCGIIVNVTPLEPEWEGHVTLEFSNTTPLPAKIYANEGAAQFLFLQGTENCKLSYADRKGKYMYQKDVTLPKL